MKYETKPFGKIGNKEITQYTFTNSNNLSISFLNYGCLVTKFLVPDKNGKSDDIVLGYDNLDGYLENNPYVGAVIGRYANRIGGSSFSIDSRKYIITANEGKNCLHGGRTGFNKVAWYTVKYKRDNAEGLEFRYLSPDNEEGFPGNLNVKIIYLLTEDNEFVIEYMATTDKETVLNLTQHNYWNLAGENNGDILNHRLMINADNYTPADNESIPTGEIIPVKNTPMDFTTEHSIGSRINDDYAQIRRTKGYDHNWALNQKEPNELILAATVHEPASGRFMEVLTTEPGIQFYSGNALSDKIIGKNGKPFFPYKGLCLETQHFPDSPNKPQFPSTLLRPGEVFTSKTVYRFSVK